MASVYADVAVRVVVSTRGVATVRDPRPRSKEGYAGKTYGLHLRRRARGAPRCRPTGDGPRGRWRSATGDGRRSRRDRPRTLGHAGRPGMDRAGDPRGPRR